MKDRDVTKCNDASDGGCSSSLTDNVRCYVPGSQPQNQTQSIIVGSVRRTIWSHDGITDLWLEHSEATRYKGRTMILDMSIPALLADSKTAVSWNRTSHWEFWMQRENFRTTILTSETVVVTSPHDGVIQIFISLPDKGSEAFRMRILMEQVDSSRPAGHEKSYFGVLAAEDFFQPLEKFLVLSEATS